MAIVVADGRPGARQERPPRTGVPAAAGKGRQAAILVLIVAKRDDLRIGRDQCRRRNALVAGVRDVAGAGNNRDSALGLTRPRSPNQGYAH